MGQVTTTKSINVNQLSLELNTGIITEKRGITSIVRAETLTDLELQTAIDAHNAIDEQSNSNNIQTRLKNDLDSIQTSIEALTAIINKTNDSITAKDTKDIAREVRSVNQICKRLIRMVINDYTSVD